MREMRLTVLAHITRAAGPNKESDEVLATRVQNTVAARNECKIKQAELANGIETLKSVFMNPYAELKPAKSIVGPVGLTFQFLVSHFSVYRPLIWLN